MKLMHDNAISPAAHLGAVYKQASKRSAFLAV
jgi:hypothetical protein